MKVMTIVMNLLEAENLVLLAVLCSCSARMLALARVSFVISGVVFCWQLSGGRNRMEQYLIAPSNLQASALAAMVRKGGGVNQYGGDCLAEVMLVPAKLAMLMTLVTVAVIAAPYLAWMALVTATEEDSIISMALSEVIVALPAIITRSVVDCLLLRVVI